METHVDGRLRSIQWGWTESDACYVRFRDEQNWFCFDFGDEKPKKEDWETDVMYENRLYMKAGSVMAEVMNQPDVFFIGHHYNADAPWMQCKLGLHVLGKLHTDTEFAQQTVDEASELGLERGIAMKYTTLGRYDLPLTLWKRENKKLCENGYGYVPDEILIPYAINDVIAPFRAVPIIRQQMRAQGLEVYYDTIFRPFTSDVFVNFVLEGLPMDIPLMHDLRDLFSFAKEKLEKEFKLAVYADAKVKLFGKIHECLGQDFFQAQMLTQDAVNLVAAGKKDTALEMLQENLSQVDMPGLLPFVDHLEAAPDFNIRSPNDMRRWVFEVSGMTPVKSTNQKANGLPSMAWEKVLELPRDRQALYTPAVDKQTVQILSEKMPILDKLLDLNVVGNLCKGFLKEATSYLTEDGEEVVEEAGLFQWLCSDGRIHGQTSCTETGRPRG